MRNTAAEDQRPKRKFIVYVDESGDHSLAKVDESYPVFVLAFCVFYQGNYVDNVVSALERLKFEKFGHDIVILHERDIRKETGPFKFRFKKQKEEFIDQLTTIIEESRFILIAAVIDKRALEPRDEEDPNPYHVALRACLDALHALMKEKGQQESILTSYLSVGARRKIESWSLSFGGFAIVQTTQLNACPTKSSSLISA